MSLRPPPPMYLRSGPPAGKNILGSGAAIDTTKAKRGNVGTMVAIGPTNKINLIPGQNQRWAVLSARG